MDTLEFDVFVVVGRSEVTIFDHAVKCEFIPS